MNRPMENLLHIDGWPNGCPLVFMRQEKREKYLQEYDNTLLYTQDGLL